MSDPHTFAIHPVTRFQGSSAAISRPKEIACFSYDDNHQYFSDDRSLRYFYPPRLGTDLCRGFETFRKFDDAPDEHLESLLKTLIKYEQTEQSPAEAEIVTWRGMMTKIMATPYDDDGFEMNATRFDGTIFIEENHAFKVASRAEQSKQRRPPGLPSQDMMSFWGYKFETLCTIPAPWDSTSREYIEHREHEIVDNNAQYCSVVRTAIGKTNLILGGEIDAVWDAKPLRQDDPVHWVELKTSAVIESDRDVLKYERKLLKFWLQSFLIGTPKIVVGMRSKDGVLQHLEELETQKLPGMVKKHRKTWDGNVCINFTAALLEWLKATISDDGVWLIRRRRRSTNVELLRVIERGTGDILSKSYVDWKAARSQEPKFE